MEQGYAELTVLFEDPFWVGIYERREGRTYQVCKITFGAEPKDYEVYVLLAVHWERRRAACISSRPKASSLRGTA